jgi:hypothetical protein
VKGFVDYAGDVYSMYVQYLSYRDHFAFWENCPDLGLDMDTEYSDCTSSSRYIGRSVHGIGSHPCVKVISNTNTELCTLPHGTYNPPHDISHPLSL